MIRQFEDADIPYAHAVHKESELDEACFPDLFLPNGERNALFIGKELLEVEGDPVMMSFLRITGELFVLVDHTKGTPEKRWAWMKELKEHMVGIANKNGLDQLTAFVPVELEESFAKRLLDMGFVKSRFIPYTLVIE
jgi:hypothetical protein